jgi:hypothetical protein
MTLKAGFGDLIKNKGCIGQVFEVNDFGKEIGFWY